MGDCFCVFDVGCGGEGVRICCVRIVCGFGD